MVYGISLIDYADEQQTRSWEGSGNWPVDHADSLIHPWSGHHMSEDFQGFKKADFLKSWFTPQIPYLLTSF